MSLDARAATLATGPGGHPGWAAKAQCGLCHTPADAFAGFRTGRILAGGMEARWRVLHYTRLGLESFLGVLGIRSNEAAVRVDRTGAAGP